MQFFLPDIEVFKRMRHYGSRSIFILKVKPLVQVISSFINDPDEKQTSVAYSYIIQGHGHCANINRLLSGIDADTMV